MTRLLILLTWPFRGGAIREAAERRARARIHEEKPHAPVAVVRRIQGRWAAYMRKGTLSREYRY